VSTGHIHFTIAILDKSTGVVGIVILIYKTNNCSAKNKQVAPHDGSEDDIGDSNNDDYLPGKVICQHMSLDFIVEGNLVVGCMKCKAFTLCNVFN